MGSFHLLVVIDRTDDPIERAVRVDRKVYPHMRYYQGGDRIEAPLDSYGIEEAREATDLLTAYAYIGYGDAWQSQYLPDKIADDGEPGDHVPLDEWIEEVQDFVRTVGLSLGHEIVVCRCHD